MEKLTPGTNKDTKYNAVTGKVDSLNGDYSFKNFVKIEWDWCLVTLGVWIVAILQLAFIVTTLGWVAGAYDDSIVGGIFATLFYPVFPGLAIGLPIWLRKWWKQLGGWI